MKESRLSRRYAKAIFDLAREEKREEASATDMDRFADAYSGSELQAVLNNPAVGVEKRKGLALRIANRLEVSTLVVKFLSFLIDQDRLVYFPSIVYHFRRFLDEAMGRVQARLVAPSPLAPDTKESLALALKGICGKDVIFKEETRPDLIGGLLIELEGKVYDGTLRTRLQGLRATIERG